MPLADAIFWISAALCVVAEASIVRSALVVRTATAAGASLPPVRRATEVVWSVVPALALVVVLALTWRAIHRQPVRMLPPATATSGVAL